LTRVLSAAVNAERPFHPPYDRNARDNAHKYEVFEVGVNARLIEWLELIPALGRLCHFLGERDDRRRRIIVDRVDYRFVAASGDTVPDPQWINIHRNSNFANSVLNLDLLQN
jgi:hypothetical protein